jgi:hypothetical protein
MTILLDLHSCISLIMPLGLPIFPHFTLLLSFIYHYLLFLYILVFSFSFCAYIISNSSNISSSSIFSLVSFYLWFQFESTSVYWFLVPLHQEQESYISLKNWVIIPIHYLLFISCFRMFLKSQNYILNILFGIFVQVSGIEEI